MNAHSLRRSSAIRFAAALGLLAGSSRADFLHEWISTLPVGSALSAGLYAMTVDASGTTYVTGTGGLSYNTDVVTAAFAPNGTLLWTRTFDGPEGWHDQGRAVALGPGGLLWVAGNTPGPGNYANVLLLGYDAQSGTLTNTIQYSSGPFTSEFGGAVATDTRGNVYVAGGTVGDGGDALVLKFDAAGALQWKRDWDGPAFAPFSQDHATEIQIDPFGDVVVLIYGVMPAMHADYVVLKYAPGDGSTLWEATWGGSGEDSANDMEIDAAGDVYVTGTALQFTNKFSTIKLDGADGQLLWQAYDGIGVRDSGRALALDGLGGVYVTGGSDPDGDQSNQNDNTYTVKRDADSGALVWTHFYGANCIGCLDVPSDVAADPAGHAFVAGYTNSPPYSGDMITFVLDAASGAEVDRGLIGGGPGQVATSGFLQLDADHDLYNGGRSVNFDTGAVAMSLVKHTTLATPLYQMKVTELVGGANAQFAVSHATPLELQFLGFGLGGTADIPLLALGTTLGIANPHLLVTGQADAGGAFSAAFPVPAGIAGITVWFQSLQMNGATPVVKRTIQ